MTSRAAALRHFKKADPHFHTATKTYHASLPERLIAHTTRAALFTRLVQTVISQQLGIKAARIIFARVKKACGELSPKSLLAARAAALCAAGLSRAKIKTLREIARAVKRRELDLCALKSMPETEVAEKLVSMRGLGPWSAEMFLMFALGRADVFSPGDFGLARAMETIYGLPRGIPREKMLAIAEKWSPHRTYASLLLWLTRDTKAD